MTPGGCRVKSGTFCPTDNALAEANIVEIESLTFAYDARPVLQGVNLKIRRGQVVAIMGGSGCGKTTLLRIIGGALVATEGSTRVLGEEMGDLNRADLYHQRRRMGMLFQFGALFTDMTVFDNVAFQMREHTDLPEELVRDLVGGVKDVYDGLNIDGFDTALPALEAYANRNKQYEANKYKLEDALKDEITREWGDLIQAQGYTLR